MSDAERYHRPVEFFENIGALRERQSIAAYLDQLADKQIDDQSAGALLNAADDIRAGKHLVTG